MNITFEFATQDDCLERMLPSDLRKLVNERDEAQAKLHASKTAIASLQSSIQALITSSESSLSIVKAERDQYKTAYNDLMSGDKLIICKSALVEIRAQAGRTGFDDGYSKCWREVFGTKPNADSLEEYADSYADKIRQGSTK